MHRQNGVTRSKKAKIRYQRREEKRWHRRLSRQGSVLMLSGLLSWSGVGYSQESVFENNVVAAGGNPDFILRDTDDGETSWFLEADENDVADQGFTIQWSRGNSGAHPFVIESDAPQNAVYIDSSGRIGLGTSTPEVSVEIVDGSPGISFESRNGPIDNLPKWQLSTGHTFQVEDRTEASVPFGITRGAPTASLWVAEDSNVGVGTTAPSEAVDVVRQGQASRFQLTSYSDASSDAAQFIQRRARRTEGSPGPVQNGDNLGLFSFRGMRPNGSFSGSRATITAQATEAWTDTAQGTRLVFGTTPNGANKVSPVLEITHDGRVLINGSQLSVPDYVFAEDYELMPLDELKAYITEHKHLPEVASETEVKDGGVDLAGTQMALLKKVEELTLYTLQQHEQLAVLEKQNAALSQHNAQLTEQNVALVQKDAVLERRLASLEHKLLAALPESSQ